MTHRAYVVGSLLRAVSDLSPRAVFAYLEE
jgi:hypothetical protein